MDFNANIKEKNLLTPQDWILAGLNVLLHEGIDNVKILPLSKQLGVSRGSFYWHFKNREDLLNHLLNYWEEQTTEIIIGRMQDIHGNALEKLLFVVESVMTNAMENYDQCIRAWASFDSKAKNYLQRVDQRRFEFVSGLLADCGVVENELDDRSNIMMAFLVFNANSISAGQLPAKREEIARKVKLILGLN